MLQLTKIIAAALFISTSAFGESADSILEKADQIRVPKESFLMKVRVENSEGDTSRFQIKMGKAQRRNFTAMQFTAGRATFWARESPSAT